VYVVKGHKNSEYNTSLFKDLFLSTENHYNVFKNAAALPLDMNERCGRYLQVL